MNLREAAKSIRSRQDLISFINSLQQDLKDHPDQWENDDLSRYLEALAAWLTDMDGYYRNIGESVPKQPDWALIGQILFAAKYYE